VPSQPEPKLLWAEPGEGYRIEKWEAYPEPYSVVPFLRLIPDDASAQASAPTVMYYPGTWHPEEALAGEELPEGTPPLKHIEHVPMALHFVRQGDVAVAVEHPGFGKLKPGEGGSAAELFGYRC